MDGLLADLGVSSHQFDTAGRGFSFRREGPLDMRMDRRSKRTAANLVATLDEGALARILREYGEVQGARRVARHLVQARATVPIATTARLAEVLAPVTPRGNADQFRAQVFQALRIAVNDELGALEGLLRASAEVIRLRRPAGGHQLPQPGGPVGEELDAQRRPGRKGAHRPLRPTDQAFSAIDQQGHPADRRRNGAQSPGP